VSLLPVPDEPVLPDDDEPLRPWLLPWPPCWLPWPRRPSRHCENTSENF
jgi:hypothetical protein